ncbi:hypothetical protein P5Y53_16215 [Dyella jiangningensis]|uniref:hypothetical protein n=1 Tax=Dyella jiangningensis TaxID=1379159 RepID=UPI0024107E89|nr:hypothetical protein [Dyella jiangningensis]MDG2539222.1 hypothetical protein [Dyella jiangningensis]
MIDESVASPKSSDDEALAVMLDWLYERNGQDELGKHAPDPFDQSGKPGTLAERFSAAGLWDWHDAIAATATARQPLQLDARLEWLMSQAAIEAAVAIRQPDAFGAIEELQSLGGLSDANLASEVCNRIAPASDNHPLLTCLAEQLQQLWYSRFAERLRNHAEANGTQPLTSRDLWPSYGGMPIGNGWAHRVAANLWPAPYMEMLAAFPAPFQHWFAYVLSSFDTTLAASLIKASPAVFSSCGEPVGPVGIFSLLEAFESQLPTIDTQATTLVETTIDKILDAISSRDDADWIGRAWLQQIIWRDNPRRAGNLQADVDAQKVLRDILLSRLSARIRPLGDTAFGWIRREHPLWAVHRVLAEASILEGHGDGEAGAAVLAKAVQDGLISATGRPAGLVTSSPEATIVARVLSGLPNIAQWFEELWRNTHEVREHLSYSAHRNLDNPAYPILAWGLTGLNSARSATLGKADFWRLIAAAVFETQRIDPNASIFNSAMVPITRVTVQLGAALVQHGDLSFEDFAKFLSDQLEPTAEHAHLWHIVKTEASTPHAIAAGRLVGATLLRQALEAGLAQRLPSGGVLPDHSARDELSDFLSGL